MHWFRPRYESVIPTRELILANREVMSEVSMFSYEATELLQKPFTLTRYVCDVCIWCGKVMNNYVPK